MTNSISFGATTTETQMPFPGDAIIASPTFATTHAITIDAPAERIWQWLVQIGQGRAGFYSDSRWWDGAVDLYYRLLSHEQGLTRVRYEKHDASVTAEWQHLRVGDAILDGPPGTARYIVRHVEPPRSLVLFTDTHVPYILPARLRRYVSAELTVSYALVPVTTEKTRMLRRMRMSCRPFWLRIIAVPIIDFWGERITARNFLRGLKRRAEMADAATFSAP